MSEPFNARVLYAPRTWIVCLVRRRHDGSVVRAEAGPT